MPAKKESTVKKETVKKEISVEKKTVKPDLREFLGEIEKIAYDLYLERRKTNAPGDEMTDWLKAEKVIKSKYKI